MLCSSLLLCMLVRQYCSTAEHAMGRVGRALQAADCAAQDHMQRILLEVSYTALCRRKCDGALLDEREARHAFQG